MHTKVCKTNAVGVIKQTSEERNKGNEKNVTQKKIPLERNTSY